MALLEDAMADAALSRVDFVCEVVAVDIHVSFVRPATGRLTATGRATGGGRSMCFCEAELADADGLLVAKALGTFRYWGPELAKG